SEALEELELVLGRIAAEGDILQKIFQAGQLLKRLMGHLLHEFEFLPVPAGQPAVQHDVHAEGLEVNVPGLDERIEECNAVLVGDMENIRIQEFQNLHPSL